MWTPFRMDGRDLEWRVSGDAPRRLDIRSLDGKFAVRAWVLDDAFALYQGKVVLSVIANPTILGEEFPPGCPSDRWPHQLGGRGVEFARHGIIHTELVRSLLGRWTHRRRHRLRPTSQDTPNVVSPPASTQRPL